MPCDALARVNATVAKQTLIAELFEQPEVAREALLRLLPFLPVEEEGRLNDPALRESFVARIFAYDRFLREARRLDPVRRRLCENPPEPGGGVP